MFQAQTYI